MAEYKDVVQNYEESMEADHDNRERSRTSDHFANAHNGQWEPSIYRKMDGRPRYTFDRCNIYIDSVMGDIEQSNFSSMVKPAGGRSSKEVALVYEGLIRYIEQVSSSRFVYNQAIRSMLTTGIGGWMIEHDYLDPISFDQDLIIRPIYNFVNSCWFDANYSLPMAEDANYAFLINAYSGEAYDEKYPEGSGLSLGVDDFNNVYQYKRDGEIFVGEYFYKKTEPAELALMSNGSVYIIDDNFEMITDELANIGITIDRTRETDLDKVCTREFDGDDWLTDDEETIFTTIPIVPCLGNFSVSEHKVLYRSSFERFMDAQRVLNYTESRRVEEGALAPRGKIALTEAQAEGHERSLNTLNTNAEPVQLYNHIEEVVPPFYLPGAQINPGLASTSQGMDAHIQRTTGAIQADQDRGLGVQSGAALDKLQDKEDSSNYKYFQTAEMCIERTSHIIVSAAPRVYDTKRQIRLLGADNTESQVTINDIYRDEQTGEIVELNNLSQGTYSVTCQAGPSYRTQQQRTFQAIATLGQMDPTILQISGDILLGTITTPGFKQVAERKRIMMLNQGIIPQSQMTPEEKKMVADTKKAAANKPPSAAEQAMIKQAEAEMVTAQGRNVEIQSKAKERQDKTQLAIGKLQLDKQKIYIQQLELQEKSKEGSVTAQLAQAKLALEQQKIQITQMETQNQIRNNDLNMVINQEQMKINREKMPDEILSLQADTLSKMKMAIGGDVIVTPENTEAYSKQAVRIGQTQEIVKVDLPDISNGI